MYKQTKELTFTALSELTLHKLDNVSWVLIEEEEAVDKAEEPDLGGPNEKVSENLMGPSHL